MPSALRSISLTSCFPLMENPCLCLKRLSKASALEAVAKFVTRTFNFQVEGSTYHTEVFMKLELVRYSNIWCLKSLVQGDMC